MKSLHEEISEVDEAIDWYYESIRIARLLLVNDLVELCHNSDTPIYVGVGPNVDRTLTYVDGTVDPDRVLHFSGDCRVYFGKEVTHLDFTLAERHTPSKYVKMLEEYVERHRYFKYAKSLKAKAVLAEAKYLELNSVCKQHDKLVNAINRSTKLNYEKIV